MALAFLLLVTIGILRWTVLRSQTPRAVWWIPATAVAWLAGLAVVFGAMAFVNESTSRGALIGVAILAALGMGAVAAAISGLALVRLLSYRDVGVTLDRPHPRG